MKQKDVIDIVIKLNKFLDQGKAHEESLSEIEVSAGKKAMCPTQDSCNEEDLNKLLYIFGIDTNYPVERQELKHRNWQGVVVDCPRWVGVKRTDQEWLDFISAVNMYQNK